MDERQELMMLRRLAELEAKAKGGKAQNEVGAPKAEERTLLNNVVSGVASGFADLGDTLLNVGTYLPGKVVPAIKEWNDERSASLQDFNNERKDSTAFNLSRIGGNIVATAPVGGVLGAGVKTVAPGANALVNAITTSGMRAGSTPGAANMLTRIAGGAVTGGASTALVSPDDAGTGALIGAALPPALAGTGKAAGVMGKAISGPAVPQGVQQSAIAARNAGYVIPPSQVKPTLVNKALEGFAGKTTTAQNASTRNQVVTNELAKKAVGASDLTPEALSAVRTEANSAYDAIKQVGAFQADDAFRESLDKAGAITASLKKDFPELVNNEVESLVSGLSGRSEFNADATIEAIKRFRFDGAANKASMDPAKKALGKAQMQISGALEDLIDRNLQKTGEQGMLTAYRDARKTLAKVYDLEKAINTSSGNVDASKLAAQLKKGRPLTGELRDIADFASQFPKAAQNVEKMGSLPQVSPLDYLSAFGLGTATGNPLSILALAARPAARSVVLSGPVQNRLAGPMTTGQNRLAQLLASPGAEQIGYRGGPLLASDR